MPNDDPQPKVDDQKTPPDPGTPPDNGEKTVPYARFKEVNDRLKAIEAKDAERAEADRKAEEAKKKAEGKLQEVIDAKDAELAGLKPQVALMATLAERENARISDAIKDLPASVKAKDPGPSDVARRIEWADTVLALAKEMAPAPKPGNGRDPKPAGSPTDAKADEAVGAWRARMYSQF
jgi:hypothetical protein